MYRAKSYMVYMIFLFGAMQKAEQTFRAIVKRHKFAASTSRGSIIIDQTGSDERV